MIAVVRISAESTVPAADRSLSPFREHAATNPTATIAVSDFAHFELLFSMVIARSVDSLISSAEPVPISTSQSESVDAPSRVAWLSMYPQCSRPISRLEVDVCAF